MKMYPQSTISEDEKKRIISILQEKGLRSVCPMCTNNQFTIADGYFANAIQSSVTSSNVVIGGPSIPTIAVICTRCGFVSQHALGALGLLPAQSPEAPK
jgi:hypothetical protein